MSSIEVETAEYRPPKGLWVVWLILGIITAAIGIWLLFDREARIDFLAIFLAIGLLFNGIVELADAGSRSKPVWGYLLGALFLIGGLIVLVEPGTGLKALAVVTGIVLVTVGVFQTASSIAERHILVHWKLLLTLGILTLIAGVFALVFQGMAVRILALLLGIRVLLFGLLQVAAAFTMREITR